MRVLVNGAYVGVDIHDTITLGSVVDARVVQLEQLVADVFGVADSVLTDWSSDSDAKVFLCFLLYHHCHYSIGSIAKKYRIYKHYLRNCIRQEYERCLLNAERLDFVNGVVNRMGINHVKAS